MKLVRRWREERLDSHAAHHWEPLPPPALPHLATEAQISASTTSALFMIGNLSTKNKKNRTKMGLFGIPSEAKGIFQYQSEEHLDTTQVMIFFFSRTFQKAQRSKGFSVSTESTLQSLTFSCCGRGVLKFFWQDDSPLRE